MVRIHKSYPLRNCRGDLAIGLAVVFSLVTIGIIATQRKLVNQKIRVLYQVSEGVNTFDFNEINVWRLFYRNKAGISLTTPIDKGTVTTTVGGVTTTKTFFSTDRSEPGPSTGGAPGAAGVRYCAGGNWSKLCMGTKDSSGLLAGATWGQEAYIKASNAEANDNFGSCVSLNGDTLAVAATGEGSGQTTVTNGPTSASDNAKPNSGALYVYKRTGSTWAQEAYIKASNADAGDTFGSCPSIDGNSMAVGASREASNQTAITNGAGSSGDNSIANAGAVYVYVRTGPNWSQQAYIKAANAKTNYYFGAHLSLSGDTLAAASSWESSQQTGITAGGGAGPDILSPQSGAVYIYKRTGVNWAQQAYIKADNADAGDFFGDAVSLNSNTLAVGAHADSSDQTTITATASMINTISMFGSAYVYTRVANNWSLQAYIKPPNPDSNDFFGLCLSLDVDTLAVCARNESSNMMTIINGAGGSADNSELFAGAVYVFKRTAATWAQEAYIKAANARSWDNFGNSVSMYGDSLAVGDWSEDSGFNSIINGSGASFDTSKFNAGAVFVYKRNVANWAQQAYIKAANSDATDDFGNTTSLYGDTLAVGAYFESSNQTTITNGIGASADNSASHAGAVYVYKRS